MSLAVQGQRAEAQWARRGVGQGEHRENRRMEETAVRVDGATSSHLFALARREEQKLRMISPALLTTHLQFPILCVSGFNQQTYDYKRVKPEGPFTKPGGTRGLKVGVPWDPGGGGGVSPVKRWRGRGGELNSFQGKYGCASAL